MPKPIKFVQRRKKTSRPSGPRQHRFPELARYFALAFISYQTDVRFQTALKNYGQRPTGRYWLDLADQVAADYAAGRFG